MRPGGAPALDDRHIRDLPDLLQPGDCLVVNDSKVIAARLKGRRIGRGGTESGIEATLHKRLDGSTWKAFVRPAKKLEVGDKIRLIPGHCDPTVNLYDWIVGLRGGKVECVWPVTARGAFY